MRARPPRRTMRSPPCGRHANAGSPSPDNALLTACFRSLLAPADPPCLALDSEAVALEVGAVDVDAVAFRRLAQADDMEALARAVELYRGDLLEGLAFRGALFEDWLIAERERRQELALGALA